MLTVRSLAVCEVMQLSLDNVVVGSMGFGRVDYQYKPKRCRPQVCTNLILLTMRRVTDIVVSACIWALLRHPLGLELGHWYHIDLSAVGNPLIYMQKFYLLTIMRTTRLSAL